jgi:hypothetical protein
MQKKYSINWEDDRVASVEVDGVQYGTPDQIPDPEDREKVEQLISRSTGQADADFDKEFGKDFDKEFEEEFRELERQSKKFPNIIILIFLSVAILSLVIAAILAFSTTRTLLSEKSTPGYVVDLVSRRDSSGNEYFYPLVEFDLPDGSRQRVQLAQGSWPAPYELGQAVTVLYNPAQPRQARIKGPDDTIIMYIGALITGFVGLVFLGVTLFARWLLKEPSDGKAGSGSALR